jgi:ubiquitin C-terminal hydrolase
MTPNTFRCLSTSPTTIPAVLQFFYFGGGGAKFTMTKKETTGHTTTTSGYDAPTPIISNRKASAPRFSSLDGPILRVEYYKEPVVASHAVLLSSSSDHAAVAGVVVQLGLQASQFLYKRTLAKMVAAVTTTMTIPSLSSGRRRTANSSHNRNSFGGLLDGALPEPPVQGIANYGQTCFANAILQALAASTSMYEYTKQMRPFSATANELYLVLQQLRSNSTAATGSAGLLTTTTTIIVDPRPLLRQFYTSTHEQNDAQEFLQRMIDSIVDQVDWSAYTNFRERSKTRSSTTTSANRRRQRQPLSPPTAIGSITVVDHGGGDGVLVASEDEWWSSSDEDDDEQRSWSSISSCQVAVQLKSSRLRKAVVLVDDDNDKLCHGTKLNAELVQDHNATVSLLPAISENRLDDAKVNGVPHGGANMVEKISRGGLGKNGSAATQQIGNSNGREVMFSESKEEMNPGDDDDDHDDHEDDLHVNFSKDTVISAESVWIHSYSYSMGEEKKDDTGTAHLPTGLDVLKQSAFCIDTKTATLKKKQETLPEMVVEYSALSPSPLHGWMGTLLTCDACQSKDRPIRNALCCTIPVLPSHPHLVDCVRAVLTSERVEHVQCDYCPRDPALVLERQDWMKAIQHASGDTSATQAELERVEEALQVPIYSDATKASIFMRLPSVLSLHIQRRRPDGRKNTQHVSFDELFVINGARYRLIAVIEHLGGPNAGHYVCYRPQWWRISDRSVRQVDWNQVRSSQAYMLFYERIDTTNSITTADGGGGSD